MLLRPARYPASAVRHCARSARPTQRTLIASAKASSSGWQGQDVGQLLPDYTPWALRDRCAVEQERSAVDKICQPDQFMYLSEAPTFTEPIPDIKLPPFQYPSKQYQKRESRETIFGEVTAVIDPLHPSDAVSVRLRCLNGREFQVRTRTTTNFSSLTLFDKESRGVYPANPDPAEGASPSQLLDKVHRYLRPGLSAMVTGVLFEGGTFDASVVHLLYDLSGNEPKLVFEKPDWWRDQITQLSDTWLEALRGPDGQYDWAKYRTNMGISFQEIPGMWDQEVATLSRLIYGLSSAYHLTGNMKYLEAAESGIKYQRDNFKLSQPDSRTTLWTSARAGKAFKQTALFGNNRNSIPIYEQIYALAGLAQFYRITHDPKVLLDIKETVYAFKKFFYDQSKEKGFFSHIDFATKSPHAESLKNNEANNIAKKNWNSIGDHIPAYLINLILALGEGEQQSKKECEAILEECTELIVEKFVYKGFEQAAQDARRIVLVPERFYQDWGIDDTYDWQQDRGIVGHNCKIVWNLHRAANYFKSTNPELSEKAEAAANKLAQALIQEGAVDGFRGGCHDAVERRPSSSVGMEFAWLNTRDFWQQEQAILAFLIAHGSMGDGKFLKHARAAQAFYNAFFLNFDGQSIFFRTDADGTSVTTGEYGQQASHSKSGYHTHENAFLAYLYISSLVTGSDFVLHFHPSKHSTGSINVMPDFLPSGTLKVEDARPVFLSSGGPGQPCVVVPSDRDLLVTVPDAARGSALQVRYKVNTTPAPIQPPNMTDAASSRPKVGVVVEDHYIEAEIAYYQQVLPQFGYEVVFISNLWGNKELTFYGNDYLTPLTVRHDFATFLNHPQGAMTLLQEEQFQGFILAAGYAMDRLRYQQRPEAGQPNMSPAVQFLRTIDGDSRLVIGGACHSLWLYCAAPELLKGRTVTCASNIVSDVSNAGAQIQYDPAAAGGLVDAYVDHSAGKATLVTGMHPGVLRSFLTMFVGQLPLLGQRVVAGNATEE